MKIERRRAWLMPLLLFCLAPTPGDIGGCGQAPQDLDPEVFFASQAAIECSRCVGDCRIESGACDAACASRDLPHDFPNGCFPLVHDGTVCLRALTQASCSEMRKVMSDPPRVPSECNFCPPEAAPGP